MSEWSKEPPREPGWWFTRTKEYPKPAVVEVFVGDAYGVAGKSGLAVERMAYEVEITLDDYCDPGEFNEHVEWWTTPIEEPPR